MKYLLLYFCSAIFLFSAAAENATFAIVPQPQSMTTDGASFEIAGITISDPGRFPKAEKALREELNLQNISSESKVGKLYPVKFLLDPKLKREEYRLQTTPETATIRGAGDAGALHGVWTLRQLIRRRGEKFFLPAVRIHDYPDIRTRAVMFPSGLSSTPGSPETIQTFKKYIRAFAAMKYNALLLSPSRFTLWDSHCFPHRIPHFTKKHWKEIAEYASFYEMKIIPAFQALSHANWLADDMKEMSEIMEVTSTEKRKHIFHNTVNWCSSNPAARKRLDRILEEAIELFQPEYVHMGFDEISLAPYLVCGKCKGKDPHETFYREVMHYYNKLKSEKIGMIVYQDDFLPPELVKRNQKAVSPGAPVLDRLPKDIIINIWDYSPGKMYFRNMFRHFADKGFATAGMSYFRRNSTRDLAEAMADTSRADIWITSLWAEANNLCQWMITPIYSSTCLTGADYAWNSKQEHPYRNYGNSGGWLYRTAHGKEKSSVYYTELPLPANAVYGRDWPVLESHTTLPELRQTAENESSGLRWGTEPRPLLVVTPGSSETIPVNNTLESLDFVHATSVPPLYYPQRPTPRIAQYEVLYQNRRRIDIPIHFRRDVNDWNAFLAPTTSRDIYSGQTATGTRIQFSSFHWENPYPSIPVKEIRLKVLPVKGLPLSIAVAGISAGSQNPITLPNTLPAEKYVKGDEIRSAELCNFQNDDGAEQDRVWNVVFSGVLRGTAGYRYTPEGLAITSPHVDGDGRIILDARLDKLPEFDRNGCIAFDYESDGDMRLTYNVYLLKGATKTGGASSAMINKIIPFDYDTHRKGTFTVQLSKLTTETGSITQSDATHLRISVFVGALHGPLFLRISNLRLLNKPFENHRFEWTELD